MELGAPSSWGDEVGPEFALERAIRLVHPRTGVLQEVTRVRRMADLPRLYQYRAVYGSTRVISDVDAAEGGGGTGLRPGRARLKAVGEALERYALGIYRSDRLVWGTAGELGREHPCLDLSEVAGRVPSTSARERDRPLQWSLADDLEGGPKQLVPAQMVFVPFRYRTGEREVREPTSNGAASGTSYGGALLRGILELVEREAVLLTCLHRHRAPAVDLSELDDRLAASALARLDFCRLELRVLDVTTDLGIPVFLAVLVDRTGRYPAVNLGAKAALNPSEAIVGAIEEVFHSLVWGRSLLAGGRARARRVRAKPTEIASLEDRLLYWSPTEALAEIPFLLEWVGPARRIPAGNRGPHDLGAVIRGLRRRGVELCAVDLTPPDVAAHGFKVVRVISPQLFPLYLDERIRGWNGARLFNVPARLGWTEAKRRPDDLFASPHPFL